MFRRFTLLWYLLLILFGGVIVIAGILFVWGFLCAHYPWEGMNVTTLHVAQWSQTFFIMILPPILWVRYSLKEPVVETLRLHAPKVRSLVYVLLMMVASFPLIESLCAWCAEWPWPQYIRDMAEQAALQQAPLMEQMLSPTGLLPFIELVLLMSVCTAIGEELLFRGALMRLCGIQDRNHTSAKRLHIAAILIGLLFAIIHFEYYGFIARWTLGSLFVYLVYWTGSLWPAILAHALNNLFALLVFKFSGNQDMTSTTTTFDYSGWFLVACVIVLAGAAERLYKDKSTVANC